MPRKPRLVLVGYPHHIILRGNNKSTIFYDDKDKRFFIDCLKNAKLKTNSKIYSYCLMPNHVHLIVEPSMELGLSNMLQSLGRKYVQYFNHRYKRSGTLWEGRFKSSLISKDNYLIMCSRYIELNPVRAKIIKAPEEYIWSSSASKIGTSTQGIIDYDPFYLSMGKQEEERRQNYKKFLYEPLKSNELNFIRLATQKGSAIGTNEFIERISNFLGREIALKKRGRPKKSL